MDYRFENLKELKKHIQENGMGEDKFVANPDREPERWCFAEGRLMAAISALRMAPYLVLSTEDADGQVFEVKGCEAIQNHPHFPEFVNGTGWLECWGKTLTVLDDMVPVMPVSVFNGEQVKDMLAEV